MKKWKRALTLSLALLLSLALAVPAMAAGEKKVVTDEKHGVTITMDGFLREETHRYQYYRSYLNLTLMVVSDNSKVIIEAMEGRKYAKTGADENEFYEETGTASAFAYRSWKSYEWYSEEQSFGFVGDADRPLTGPYTETMAPAQGEGEDGGVRVSDDYSVHIICESDFAKLVPFEGKPVAAGWAQGALEKAYDAGSFDGTGIDPFKDDCAQGMTRRQFASVAVNLYTAMGGSLDGVSSEHPFTDVKYDDNVGYAYDLGLVSGTGAATFSPDATLTREQAAVLLSNVYAKLRGAVPQASATGFTDDGAVSSWAKSGVAFMSDKGIVSGVGGGNFAPQQTLSIQEAVVMAQKMLETLK